MVNAKWAVEWWDSERGWGQSYLYTQFFETKDEAQKAINDHWDEQPGGRAPDYYIFPSLDSPYLKEV